MPYTAQDHINDFTRLHPDVDSTTALRLLNEVDEMILFHVPLRRSYEDLALTSGVYEYDLDETILRVWGVQLYTSAVGFHRLTASDVDSLDLDFPSWRSSSAGTPVKWYETASMTSGQIGLTPPPSLSTLRVASATSGLPIVITTTVAHGLASGTQVRITGVLGTNPAANGLYWIKSTGTFTFELYSDPSLGSTFRVQGSGSATANTGMIACTGSPKLVLECSKRTALVLATPMPSSPQIKPLYRFGMSAIYSLERRLPNAGEKWSAFERMLGEQGEMKMKRQARKALELTTFKQRFSWRASRGGRGC